MPPLVPLVVLTGKPRGVSWVSGAQGLRVSHTRTKAPVYVTSCPPSCRDCCPGFAPAWDVVCGGPLRCHPADAVHQGAAERGHSGQHHLPGRQLPIPVGERLKTYPTCCLRCTCCLQPLTRSPSSGTLTTFTVEPHSGIHACTHVMQSLLKVVRSSHSFTHECPADFCCPPASRMYLHAWHCEHRAVWFQGTAMCWRC
jgi:hypothetical protein